MSAVLGWLGLIMSFGWAVAGGSAHLKDNLRFRSSVAQFEVLPHRLVATYATLTPLVLLVGAFLILLPRQSIHPVGGLAIAAVFLSFTAATLHANFRRKAHINCGCVGGYLATDLTWASWVLPGAISICAVIGALNYPFGHPVLPTVLASGAISAAAVSLICVLIVEGGAAAERRGTWISYKTGDAK
jgi:hypothetical protein